MCYPLGSEVKVKLNAGEARVDGRNVAEFLRQEGLVDQAVPVLAAISNSLQQVEFLVTLLPGGGASWVGQGATDKSLANM